MPSAVDTLISRLQADCTAAEAAVRARSFGGTTPARGEMARMPLLKSRYAHPVGDDEVSR